MSLDRYPPGGCILRDKTTCTQPAATCCEQGLAIRWPGQHDAVEAVDFMPPQWCGGCETCSPAPMICGACSHGTDGGPLNPVSWPCAVARRAQRDLALIPRDDA